MGDQCEGSSVEKVSISHQRSPGTDHLGLVFWKVAFVSWLHVLGSDDKIRLINLFVRLGFQTLQVCFRIGTVTCVLNTVFTMTEIFHSILMSWIFGFVTVVSVRTSVVLYLSSHSSFYELNSIGRIYRIYGICRTLFSVILEMKIIKNSFLQIL